MESRSQSKYEGRLTINSSESSIYKCSVHWVGLFPQLAVEGLGMRVGLLGNSSTASGVATLGDGSRSCSCADETSFSCPLGFFPLSLLSSCLLPRFCHSCCSHLRVLGTPLVHECHISCSHARVLRAAIVHEFHIFNSHTVRHLLSRLINNSDNICKQSAVKLST